MTADPHRNQPVTAAGALLEEEVILLLHGRGATAEGILPLGEEVTLRRYPGLGHTIGAEELDEARRLVRAALTC